MKRVLLVDLSGIFWANWHASGDEVLGAAHDRTLAKVGALADGFDAVAVACDRGPYKRKALSEAYKAQRDTPPPQALEQLERVKRRLEADGLLLWECEGYEADDVIATACMGLSEHAITIASGDKDLLALVSDELPPVRVVSPLTAKLMTEDTVREKFGVPPRLIPDLLALMGDKSDNVAGVPGVGEKRGAELLTEYGDLDGVLANAPAVPGKVGEALRASVESVRLARQLVTLMLDAPIKPLEIFERREVKPLGKPGEWTDAQFDAILPRVVKAPEPATTAAQVLQEQQIQATGQQGQRQGQALAIPPRVQAIAPRPVEWAMQLEPSSAKEAYIVAKHFAESRLYPNLGSQDALFTVILRGRSLGLDAATSCAMFHVVEGRPVMHAELIIGLVQRSGKCEYFECVESTDERAAWVAKRVGGRAELRIEWDIERALRAGLVQADGRGGYKGVSRSGRPSNWDKYRRTMLRWRAGTELAHAIVPEVVSGLVAPDEASDETEAA